MKLIGSNTSPYVRKARIAMAEKHVECQYETEDVWSPTSRIRESNPLGKVPCLLLDDGEPLYDSRVIVEYLDNLTPVHRLIPPAGRERAEVRRWEALADGVLDAALLIRLEHSQREESQRSPKWIAHQRVKIDAGLEAMSEGLGEDAWLCGGRYSLADLAVGCTLGYLLFRFPDIAWRSQHPNLGRFADKLFARQPFIDTMPA